MRPIGVESPVKFDWAIFWNEPGDPVGLVYSPLPGDSTYEGYNLLLFTLLPARQPTAAITAPPLLFAPTPPGARTTTSVTMFARKQPSTVGSAPVQLGTAPVGETGRRTLV